MLKKIVVIGPESTGKSTLCKELAAYYETIWCQEYAREYLLNNGTNYNFDDLSVIARGQLALEETHITQAQANNLGMLFLDTNMYVMKVWCEFVFAKCHRFILDEIVKRKYDLYLLCNTDLPWVKDDLREYPDLETRESLLKMYKDLLINQQTPWAEVSGTSDIRLKHAVDAIDSKISR